MASAPWWQLVGFAAPPRLEEAVLRPKAGFFHLLQIALLERGEPMADAEIAQRLDALGVRSGRTDLVTALGKAWHGLPPVRRLADGRLGIDINYRWLSLVPLHLGLVQTPQTTARTVAEEPPVAPPDTVPITRQECDALLACNGLASMSDARLVAAIIEAHGSRMQLEAINAIIRTATGGWRQRRPIAPERLEGWREPLVCVRPGEPLCLGENPRLLMGMRAAVRARAYVLLRAQERSRQAAAWRARTDSLAATAVHAEATQAPTIRRVVVRAYPGDGLPRALSVLDFATRSISTLIDASVATMAALVADTDLVVGLEPERMLTALGLERRVADLSRHPHTRQLNRRGRTLRITTSQLISASVGISRPLYEAAAMRRYLAEGAETALRRRLESDVKALAAFYRYGRLHGAVRLRWGFLDECRPVDWPGSPGDPLYRIVEAARAAGKDNEVVAGSAPGWAEPWARAVRGRPTLDYHALTLENAEGVVSMRRAEIQSVRLCSIGDASDQRADASASGQVPNS